MNEVNTVQDGVSTSSSFIESFCDYFSAADLKTYFRLTKTGLFVNEDASDKLTEAYQNWLQVATGSKEKKSIEKCKKRLFGSLELHISYLIDGKTCISGFLMELAIEKSKIPGIAFYQGSLLDTKSFLHPKDPILTKIPNLKAALDPKEGLMLDYSAGKQQYKFASSILKEFIALACNDSFILEKYPESLLSLRASLKPLINILKKCRLVSLNQGLLVPSRFKGEKRLKFFRFKGYVFVLGSDNKILGLYGLEGRNFSNLVREEIASLGSGMSKMPRALSRFKLSVNDKHILGKIHSGGIDYSLSPRVFYEFIRLAPKSSKLKSSLGNRYTVVDCLIRFCSFLKSSKRAEEIEVPRSLRRLPNKHHKNSRKENTNIRYRISGVWVFMIDPRKTIVSIVKMREDS